MLRSSLQFLNDNKDAVAVIGIILNFPRNPRKTLQFKERSGMLIKIT